ncbi:hypothetical protein DF027_31200 [Burkholderia cenocepacia]|jgi:hypothetical protein|nr:hypothetical protein DIE18_18060 [Burkholderia sp. Bp9125]RQV32339.1 hypothetical protein DF027_31200 [Burkholderia cenocepacia]RQV32871.1 hypothetical protein DF028_31455 [Burkholderia cenocepacia]RQV68933.1 hypothetical protein DF010_32060 [Burkholderia cenocepacia]
MLADLLLFFPVRRRTSSSIFLFLALLAWSCFAAELYYSYYALERAESAGRIAVARKTQEQDEVL